LWRGSVHTCRRRRRAAERHGDTAGRGQNCTTSTFTISGRVAGDGVEFALAAPGVRATGTLRKGMDAGTPSGPSSGGPSSGGPGGDAVSYRGAFGSSAGLGASLGLTADLRVANGRLTGQITERRCGAYTVDLPVSASGDISGTLRFLEDTQCSPIQTTVTGKAGADSLPIDFRNQKVRVFGTVPRIP
jgi:hypothetical protein